MKKGYLTAAYKHHIYAEQAVCLSLSFKYKGDHTPISIVVDQKNYIYIQQKKYTRFFDQVIVLPDENLYDFIGKLYSALQTPYEDTIYFDSDCLLISHAAELNTALSVLDFCVPGEDLKTGVYAGKNIPEWLTKLNLLYIPIFNAGVFRFNHKGKKVVEEALGIMHQADAHQLPKADGGLNEQVALGIAMSKNNIHAIPFENDYHFSFYNANSHLVLDLKQGICKFTKEQIHREPYIFHYTPLYHAGFYYSRSRRLLMTEINKLRKAFDIEPTEFFKPKLRDHLALIKNGKFFKDTR